MTPEERAEQVQLRLMRELDINLEGALIPSEAIIADALRAAQAEQRQRIIAIIKGGDRPWQELVDAILAQEDE